MLGRCLLGAGCLLEAGCAPTSAPTQAPPAVAPAPPAPSVPAGGNLLLNVDFSDGKTLPWTSSFSAPATGELGVSGGAACLVIEQPGGQKWDAQIRHREMVIQKEHTYSVAIKI